MPVLQVFQIGYDLIRRVIYLCLILVSDTLLLSARATLLVFPLHARTLDGVLLMLSPLFLVTADLILHDKLVHFS